MADTYVQDCGIEHKSKPLQLMVQVGGRKKRTPQFFGFPSISSRSDIHRTLPFGTLYPLKAKKKTIISGARR